MNGSFVLRCARAFVWPALAAAFVCGAACNDPVRTIGSDAGNASSDSISAGAAGPVGNSASSASNGIASGGTAASGPSTGAGELDSGIAGGGSGGILGTAGASPGSDSAAGNTPSSGGMGCGDACATGGVAGSGCADPTAPNSCGNGTIEAGELCDGIDLRNLTCEDIDPIFTGGTLGCAPNTCTWDTSRCITNGTCNNGVIDPGEDCEPSIFYSELTHYCHDYISGSDNALVECDGVTCKYDFSNCAGVAAPVCGNGIREGGEQCDGVDRRIRFCSELSPIYQGGTLGCRQDCELDVTRCERCDGARCGNGIREGTEWCDGTPTMTCADVNRLFGQVTCTHWCTNDTSNCTGGCSYTPSGWICN